MLLCMGLKLLLFVGPPHKTIHWTQKTSATSPKALIDLIDRYLIVDLVDTIAGHVVQAVDGGSHSLLQPLHTKNRNRFTTILKRLHHVTVVFDKNTKGLVRLKEPIDSGTWDRKLCVNLLYELNCK